MSPHLVSFVTSGSATWKSYLNGGWQGTEAGSKQGSAVGKGKGARAEGDDAGLGRASGWGLSRGTGELSLSWRWWGRADRMWCSEVGGWGQSAWESLWGNQHTTSREEIKAKYSDLENPRGFSRLRKPILIIGTYPKWGKVGPLCSVLSPKPRSDFKNRMLTPTILTVFRYLNNLKPNVYLLSTAPLHDSPCFLWRLCMPSTVK